MPVRDTDPLLGFNFSLEVADHNVTGYFTEVGGLTSEHDVVEHKVVTEDGREVVQMIPGRVKWAEISLKRGITADVGFWEWRDLVVQGDIDGARTTVTIQMYNRNYEPVSTWTLFNAWPSKVSGPELKSDSNDFTVEELTLIHEGMKRDDFDSGPAGDPS
ncbi:MAG TPA: phage tail protein [Chloroflexi bacterium]|nr:phage tail protein [Chloroflexota bacterium]